MTLKNSKVAIILDSWSLRLSLASTVESYPLPNKESSNIKDTLMIVST